GSDFDDLPKEFAPFVDRSRSISWNLDHCFAKAKENERKMEGTQKRLEQLKSEKARPQAAPSAPTHRLLKDKLESARSLNLSGDLRVLAGRSARDNLILLRQAKGWDLW